MVTSALLVIREETSPKKFDPLISAMKRSLSNLNKNYIMKKVRNIIMLSLFVTALYSCDADTTIDELQAEADAKELVVADTGEEENGQDEKE